MKRQSHDSNVCLKISKNLKVSSFDSRHKDEYLYEITDINGNLKQFTVKGKLHNYLMGFKTPKSIQDFIRYNVNGKNEQEVSAVELLINEYLVPNGVLIPESSDEPMPAKPKRRKPDYMLAKFSILPPHLVNLLSKPLVHLFRWPIFVAVTVLFTVSHVLFFKINPEEINYSSNDLLISIAIAFIGLIFHELGHASAAVKNKCRNVDIGIGLYICFVVFYADLSEIWKLKRRERFIVDSGGLYFQMIFMALIAILYLITAEVSFYLANIALALSFIWNLNPFFRLDGYWIASDIMGFDNLRASSQAQISGGISPKLVSNYRSKSGRNTGLVIYAWCSKLAFICLVIWFTLFVLKDVMLGLPNTIGQINAGGSAADFFVALIGIAWAALMIFFAFYLALGVTRRFRQFMSQLF